ncbi:MAG: hypothetical protein RMJ55_20645, partial [Roseiflexaceae bacterium]|nr:hypothetical protein [Roseiflexaceae bacterium]
MRRIVFPATMHCTVVTGGAAAPRPYAQLGRCIATWAWRRRGALHCRGGVAPPRPYNQPSYEFQTHR